jgi:hypothetical protein
MGDEPFDILSINESRLDRTIDWDTVGIQGYDMVAAIKHRNREGGGVAIYYRSMHSQYYKYRTDLVPAEVEAVCLEIIKPKCLLCQYIDHQTPALNCLTEKIETLFRQNLDNERKELILIVGDLNCDFIKNAANSQTKQLIDLINVFQLTQLIKEPTRIIDTTATLLDVAIVSKPDNICRSGVLHIGISDHAHAV